MIYGMNKLEYCSFRGIVLDFFLEVILRIENNLSCDSEYITIKWSDPQGSIFLPIVVYSVCK